MFSGRVSYVASRKVFYTEGVEIINPVCAMTSKPNYFLCVLIAILIPQHGSILESEGVDFNRTDLNENVSEQLVWVPLLLKMDSNHEKHIIHNNKKKKIYIYRLIVDFDADTSAS